MVVYYPRTQCETIFVSSAFGQNVLSEELSAEHDLRLLRSVSPYLLVFNMCIFGIFVLLVLVT